MDQVAEAGVNAGGGDSALAMLSLRVHQLRRARKLSLRQLGELSGTSASFISQLERQRTGASTATLNQIASALGISVAELFEERAGETGHVVLRRSERPALSSSHGCRKTLLSRRPLRDMEVYVGEFEIGGSTGPDLYTHGAAHEMLVVLRGVVEVSLSESRHLLEEGDSLEYPTSAPHRTENVGNSRAEVMWIIAPPTSARADLDQYVAWRPLAAR